MKVIAWITLFFQLAFPLSLSFTPAIAATTSASSSITANPSSVTANPLLSNTANSLSPNTSSPLLVTPPAGAPLLLPAARATEPYVLGPGDSILSIAKKYNLTVDELQKLNSYRTFAKPFAALTTGDEIDVPRQESKFFNNNPTISKPNDIESKIASNAMSAGKLLSGENTSGAASNMARSAVTNEINSSSQQWLNQFGTARVQLNVDNNFKLNNSALDILVPLKDSENSLLFTQLGARNKDSRNTVNIGAGARGYQDNFMFGANAFFDNDLTGQNRRVGIGAEAAIDYLKLSANAYFGLTEWHQSRDFADYNERPASGFDVRAEGYLPAYPQLGGKLMYEKYHGDEVALFGKDDRQKDPQAVTVGVNYTPAPLVTIGAEHRVGKNDANDTNLNVQLNYRMGETWSAQINKSAVAATRTLAGSRYDLVDRNNNIVLDYKKQDVIRLTLPDRVSGAGGGALTLTAQVQAKYGFGRIDWDTSALDNAGGSVSPLSQSSLALTLPFYQHILRTSNSHTISAVAYDVQGNASNRAVTTIEVTQPEVVKIGNLITTVDNAKANGATTNKVQATVTDGDGQPIVGQVINFTANNQAVLSASEARTAVDGTASVTLTNTVAGISVVNAAVRSAASRSVNTTFIADESTLEITAANLTVIANNAVANGSAMNTVRAKVTDANANAVANQSVTFSASNGATVIEQAVITDADGVADSTLTNTTAGVSAVTATVGNQSQQIDTLFEPGPTTAIKLNKVTDGAIANGVDHNEIQAVLQDANGNPVPNVSLYFQADNSATLVASSPTTAADGTINARLTSLSATETVVSVTSPSLTGTTMALRFTADLSSATISTLSVIDNNAIADGVDTNRVRAWLLDNNSNPVSGVAITFAADNNALLAQHSVVTDSSGYAETTLTNRSMGTSVVTATTATDSLGKTANTHFIAGNVANITLTALNDRAIANGNDTNRVQAIVTDATGNPVAGQTLVFTSANATAQFAPTSGPTDANGMASVALANTQAGVSNVSAALGSVSNNIDTTFVAGAVAHILLSHVDDRAIANGAAMNRVQAVVTDAQGNLVAGQNVVFSSSNVTAQFAPTRGPTDVNGITTVELTNTKAGVSNVKGEIGAINHAIDTTFIADVTTAQIADGDLMIITTGSVANGAAINAVQATVTDDQGNALLGQEIAFDLSNGATVQTVSTTTGVAGRAIVTFSNITAGVTPVKATVVSTHSSRNIDTAFIADTTTASLTAANVVVITTGSLANGQAKNEVHARVTDANNNAVSGQTVTFSSGNGAALTTVNGVSDADGQTSVTLTHTLAGNSVVFARLGNQPLVGKNTSFIADESTANIAATDLDVIHNNAVANGSATNEVRAIVVDGNGNPVSGMTVNFSSTNSAVFTPTSGVTNNLGVINATLTNIVAGITHVKAEITTSTATHSQSIDTLFIADQSTASVSMLTAEKNDAVADNNDENHVRARILDGKGNPVSGINVNFSATHGVTVASATVVTNDQGYADNILTHNVALTSAVTATIASDLTGRSVDINFVAGTGARLEISRVTSGAVANGIATNRVEARLYDAQDNLVTNTPVTFTAAAGLLVSADTQTDGAGKAYATISHTVAGRAMVSAQISGSTATTYTTFIADKDSATLTSGRFIITHDHAAANGSDENTVQIQVVDGHDNAVPDMTITFTSANGASLTSPVVTNNSGIAVARLTHTVAGPSDVTASLTTINGTQNLSVTPQFIADTDTAQIAQGDLQLIHDGAIANNIATNEVRARVTDSQSNPIAGYHVTFSSGNAATITSTGLTAADGWVTATLKHTLAGDSEIVTVVGGHSSALMTHFVPDVSTATLKLYGVNASVPVIADGVKQHNVLGQVVDGQGNAIEGQQVTFSASNQATFSPTDTLSNAQGGLLILVENTHAGTTALTGTLTSNNLTNSVDLQFVANSATAALTALTVIDNNAVANGNARNQVQAHVADEHGNPVANVDVTFTATQGAQLVQSTAQTDANGNAVNGLTNTLAGVTVVSAKLATGPVVNADTLFVAGPITGLELITTADNAAADNIATNSVQATLKDANGNPVSGKTLSFVASNGAVVTAINGGVSDNNGVVLATLTSVMAGGSVVTATIDTFNKTTNTTFVAGAAAAITLSVLDNNAIANGSETNRVQAIVTDEHNNRVSGQTVGFTSADGATLTAVSGPTDVDGIATATLTHKVAGTSNVIAEVVSSSINANINTLFVPGAAADIALSVLDDGAIANGTAFNRVQATVTDAQGNPVSGQIVTFTSANGAPISVTVGTTGAEGIASATLRHNVAGISNVIVEVGTVTNNIDTHFVAGAVAAIALSVPDDGAIADGSTPNRVDAVVTDIHGNRVSGQTVIFTSDNGAAIMVVTGITGADGVATITLTHRLAGISKVTAAIGSINSTTNTTFVAGAVVNVLLSVSNNGAIANGMATNRVRVIVTDANNNRVAGQTVNFTVDNSAVIVAVGTTNTNGTTTTTLTNIHAGVSHVTAEVNGVDDSIATTFIPGAVTAITLMVPNDGAVADGSVTNLVQAVLTDTNNNLVVGQSVFFVPDPASSAQLTVVIGTTGTNGIATATLTNTVAQVSNVTASSGGVSNNIDTTFVVGAPAAIVLEVLDNDAIANGNATNRVQATVTDTHGNVVANQRVNFTSDNNAKITAATALTGADGMASTTLSHTLAGVSTITADVDGVNNSIVNNSIVNNSIVNNSIATRFIPGAVADITLSVPDDQAIANAVETNRVQGIVIDAEGNLIAGQTVNFTSANNAAIATPSVITGADGVASTTLTHTLAGVSNVIATVGSLSKNIDTHFVVGAAAQIDLKMITDDALANGNDANEVQVLVTDAQGNPVDAANVTLSSDSGVTITPATLITGTTGTTGTTDTTGLAIARLTHTVAATHTLTASVGQITQTINTTFTADVATAQIADGNLTIINNGSLADGHATNNVQAMVTDGQGNPLSGQAITFDLSNGATAQLMSTTTDRTGLAIVTFTNTTAGITNVKATVTSSNNTRDIDTTFVADTSTATILEANFTVTSDGALANGVANNRVQAKVTDAHGNALAGQTVIFSSGNGATVTTVNGASDDDGLTSATLTHTQAGESVINARLGTLIRSQNTTFIADESTATIAAADLVVVRNDAIANGSASNIVRATIRDAKGNPVAGMTVNFTSDNGATLTPVSGVTSSNGVVYTMLTHTKAGISEVTASLTTSTGHNSQSRDTLFIADNTTARVVALAVLSDDAVADNNTENKVQAQVEDANGNPLPAVNVHFIATDGVTLASAVVATDAQGYAENTLTHATPLTSTVTATTVSDAVGRSAQVSFVAGVGARVEISRVTDGAVANGSDTNQVEARVFDANDHLVPNTAIEFTVEAGAGVLVTADTQTDATGKGHTTISNITSGATRISVTANGVTANTQTNFIADKDTARLVDGYFVVANDNALANGVAQNAVLLQVLDANDNPVTGVNVTFTSANGALISPSGMTGMGGTAWASLTHTLAGPSPITATLTSAAGTSSLTVTPQFTADADTAQIAMGDFILTRDGALANNADTNEARARVTDANGNPLANYNVMFSSENGATLTTTNKTDADGWVTVTMKHTLAGNSGILASISVVNLRILTAHFVADPGTAALKLFTVNAQPVIADGVQPFNVLGRVLDAYDNPVESQRVAFTVTNQAVLSANEAVTNAEGGVSVLVTNTLAGTSTLTGTLASNGQTDALNLAFIANSSTAQLSTVAMVDNNAIADGSDQNRVRAWVVDAQNNPLENIAVTFSATQGAQLAQTTVQTDANGNAVTTLTNTVAGTSIVTAKLGATDTGKNANAVFVAGPATALELITTANNAVADNNATNSVLAILKDDNGNPVSGETVSFVASNGAVVVAANGGVSDDNGAASATLTSATAGLSVVTATSGSLTKTTNTTFTAGAVATITLTVLNDDAVANGFATNHVQAQVLDAQGNVVAGQTVNFSATQSANITPVIGTTGADGLATATLTNTLAGVSNVKAEIGSINNAIDTHFIAGVVDNVAVNVLKDGALADGQDFNSIEALLTDVNGNKIVGGTVRFTTTQGGPTNIDSLVTTSDSDGRATARFTHTVAGSTALAAQSRNRQGQASVTYVADVASAQLVNLTAISDYQPANGNSTNIVTAKVVDGQGNALTNQQVTLQVGNGAVATLKQEMSDVNGSVFIIFHNTTAGVTPVTATLDATGQREILDTHFVAGKAASVQLVMIKDGALADGTDANTIQALVDDAQGNPIAGAEVILSSNSGVSIAPTRLTTGADGLATATLTHTVAGNHAINGRVDLLSNNLDAHFIADVNTAQIAEGGLTIIYNGNPANGSDVNLVRAMVTDKFGNPLQGQAIDFVVSNGATIRYNTGATSIEGGSFITFYNTTAGITNVQATVTSSGSTRNVDTTFIADTTTAEIADANLVVTANNALANGVATNAVQAKVTDANGNILSGQQVVFSSGNGAAVTTVNGVSDANGLTNATLVHTVASTSIVGAQVGSQARRSKMMTFIADESTATIAASDMDVIRNDAIANGSASNAVRATVKDANGNAIAGMTVTFTSDNGAIFTPASAVTNSSGVVNTTLTHTQAGISTVTATLTSSTGDRSQSKDTLFIADNTTARVVALTVLNDNAVADNNAENKVQAQVEDANGNLLAGVNVNFVATDGVTLASAVVATNAEGYAENTLTHVTPLTSTVTATTASDAVGRSAQVNFVAGVGARVEISRVTDDAVANGSDTNQVEVRVFDAADNLVPNTAIEFTVAAGAGVLVTADTQTDATGRGHATISHIKSGATRVSVTANGVSANTQTNFIADKDTAALVDGYFVIANDNALANGVAQNVVLLQVLDANDNPVSGVNVTFASANGALISPSGVTGNGGTAWASLTHTLAGPSPITATLTSAAGTTNLTVTPQFMADADTAQIADGDFVLIGDGETANNVQVNQVRAKVTDTHGNPVAGRAVSITSDNGAAVSLSGNSNADGFVSALVRHTQAGATLMTANVPSNPDATARTLTMNFVANPATAALRLTQLPVNGTNTQPADGTTAHNLVGIVADYHQNPLAGLQVTFQATNQATLGASTLVSNAAGEVRLPVTNTVAGLTTVTGTLTLNNASDTEDLQFVANNATAQLSTLLTIENNALADGVAQDQVRARVIDAFGNPLKNIAVGFTATHGAKLGYQTVQTDENGNAVNTLTNTLTGTSVVTAKLGTAGTGLTANAVFVAGPAATLDLITTVDNAAADNSATNTVQATLKDATGNLVVGGVVAFVASNGATLTAINDGITNGSGIALATLTNGTPGVSTVTATLGELTKTTDTTFIVLQNLDVTVNGQTFNGDAGFPVTGFVGAKFRVNSGGDNALYNWSSSAPLLASVSSGGDVTFNVVFPVGTPAITIIATPKGVGSPLAYTFRVNQWFINNGGVTLNRDEGIAYCESQGYHMPESSQVTNAPVWANGARAIGNLWSEWGDFSAYTGSWTPQGFFWVSDEQNGTQPLAIELILGGLTTIGEASSANNVLCTRPL